MSEIDYDWVKAQLTEARIKRGPGDAALALLKSWEEIDLSDDLAKEAIEVFSKLALNHSLVADKGNEVWAPAQPGQLKVGDEIRVKSDAFDGKLGKTHNGRRGKIIAIRYGDIIVNSTDTKTPVLDGAHYSPYHLEKRIK
jgi:hypothetical protein